MAKEDYLGHLGFREYSKHTLDNAHLEKENTYLTKKVKTLEKYITAQYKEIDRFKEKVNIIPKMKKARIVLEYILNKNGSITPEDVTYISERYYLSISSVKVLTSECNQENK